MSNKKVLEKLNDLLDMQRHIILKVNLIEEEIKILKDSSPAKINNFIEKANTSNKELGKRIRDEIFIPRNSNKGIYQKGSLDEKIISNFLKKKMTKRSITKIRRNFRNF